MTLPLIEELNPPPDVAETLARFADLPGVLLLESSLVRRHLGRYSFLVADPFEWFEKQTASFGDDPFDPLRERMKGLVASPLPGLPLFTGGAAGMLAYELGGCWERIPRAGRDEFELPILAVGLYDWAIAWDHESGRAWIISHGFPESSTASRLARARDRLDEIRVRLRGEVPALHASVNETPTARHSRQTLAVDRLAPQFPAPGLDRLLSNFPVEKYLETVERVIEYIRAGDIFQANLSQRLLYPLDRTPLELYQKLRVVNPAPFGGYFANGDWAIVSASPERFLQLQGDLVVTRPIKGTRPRRQSPEADMYAGLELRASSKDVAENVMIVDLLRNDLSRVCRPGSLRVPQLCAVELYETVQHLVSEISGRLAEGRNVWDLLEAAFPGGSVTGAPKVRAMEIIAELEPTARGPYCGSLFYAGFDGSADSNILIRTFTCRRGWVQCPVGGGIIADSEPRSEYEETLDKARGMLQALS